MTYPAIKKTIEDEGVAVEPMVNISSVKKSRADRNALVLQYLPLARAMARRTSLAFDDAEQEAIIGLIRAADHFDASRNTAFPTYARYWITESLQRAAIRDLPVHVPVHVAKASFAKHKQSENCLAGVSLAGRNPANDSPANDVLSSDSPADGGSPADPSRPLRRTGDRRIDHAFAITNIHAVRVEMEYDDGSPRHDEMSAQNPWPGIENNMDSNTVKAHFRHLSRRQQHALMLHFGIGGTDGCTLEEAGYIMGISREAVRQLIVRGIEELRGLVRTG
ncbi:MAG: sigma-70 family RNA polymerase sigma factor [Acidithiobacillus sp.]|nr:sigma-70 family RNA polymerase sigma factor [Acidithiobacillus sp.]